jgi:hypothetical protein
MRCLSAFAAVRFRAVEFQGGFASRMQSGVMKWQGAPTWGQSPGSGLRREDAWNLVHLWVWSRP